MPALQKVIAIVGPTAVGKTSFGVAVAKAVHGEVISADSRQVYRGLDIGTGKTTKSEMQGVPHHLIDVADPTEVFSASDFVRLGRAAMSDIAARGKVPIVVGGTGFYIDTLLGRMTPAEVPPDKAFRVQSLAFSLEELQQELRTLDPKRYAEIDIKNPRRLIRAIEIASFPKDGPPEPKDGPTEFDVLWIGLTLPLPELRVRIHERLLARLNAGMLDEAKCLHDGGLSYERMEELGLEYRYMARHLTGKLSYDEMLVQLEKEIIAYAKRQMTWFKKNTETRWFAPDAQEKVTELAVAFCGPTRS